MTKSYLLLYVLHHCHEITKLTEVQLLCYVSCNSPIVSLKDFLLSSAPETIFISLCTASCTTKASFEKTLQVPADG